MNKQRRDVFSPKSNATRQKSTKFGSEDASQSTDGTLNLKRKQTTDATAAFNAFLTGQSELTDDQIAELQRQENQRKVRQMMAMFEKQGKLGLNKDSSDLEQKMKKLAQLQEMSSKL